MAPGPSSEPEGRAASLTFDEAEALLREAEMTLVGLMPNSSNYTFLVELKHGSSELFGVYKPARGESPLWDFPQGNLHRHEIAAYNLAKILDWPLIPPTVLRHQGPHGVGSLQLFIDSNPGRDFMEARRDSPEAFLPVALFDVFTNNADRKAGHCLLDAERRLWVIDHGLTFHPDYKLRTVLWDFAGESLPTAFTAPLERLAAALERGEPLARQLRGLLSAGELAVLRRRVADCLDPGWRFPEPTSGWSVPWPMV